MQMSKIKNMIYDDAEKMLDTYIKNMNKGLITPNEAFEDLSTNASVSYIYADEELSMILSFEFKQGRTVQ